MHCGCPLPGATIGQKLRRLVKHKHRPVASLLPPEDPAALAGTHPSDHNAVFIVRSFQQNYFSRQQREDKATKRRRRVTWQGDSVHTTNQDLAFLYPVPLFLYSPAGACINVTSNALTRTQERYAGGCAIVCLRRLGCHYGCNQLRLRAVIGCRRVYYRWSGRLYGGR